MTLYGKAAIRVGYYLGAAAMGMLIACLATTFSGMTPKGLSCNEAFLADLKATPPAAPAAGVDPVFKIRILPLNALSETQLSGRLCLFVTGAAKGDPSKPAADIPITLFLNDQRVPDPIDTGNKPQPYKLRAVAEPQFLPYELAQTANANSDAAKFWRSLLAGNSEFGRMKLRVGASRSASSTPETVAETEATLVVWRPWPLGLGAAGIVLLTAAFVIFAANSNVLRDNAVTFGQIKDIACKARAESDATPTDELLKEKAINTEKIFKRLESRAGIDDDIPVGRFSLGRSQMALWLMLSTAGFVFLWLTLGFYLNVITNAILVLLGINVATGLAAIVIDQAPSPTPSTLPPVTSSFLADITSDASGPKLQRIQVVIWTCILALIFVWNSVWNFVFVDFDTNLLLLMGIANTAYLGFKPSEKK